MKFKHWKFGHQDITECEGFSPGGIVFLAFTYDRNGGRDCSFWYYWVSLVILNKQLTVCVVMK